MKKLKLTMLTAVFALVMFIFVGTVDAVLINSEASLKDAFEGKDVTIEGTKIILNGDADFGDDVIEFDGGNYEIRYSDDAWFSKIKATSIDVLAGSLVSSANVEAVINIEKGAAVVLGGGNYYKNIYNHGILKITYITCNSTIFNGTEGYLEINGGDIASINQEGTAVINGGRYNCSFGPALNVYLDTAKTTITAGIFETTAEDASAITLISENELSENSVNVILENKFKIDYDEFSAAQGKYDLYYANYNGNIRVYREPKNFEQKLKKLLPDGETLTIKVNAPKTVEETDSLMCVLTNMFDDEDFVVYLDCWESGKVTEGTLIIQDNEYSDGAFYASYPVKIVYEEPKENNVVNDFISKLKMFNDWENPDLYYDVTDMGLINYYMTSNKSELWNYGAPGRALKYSADMIKISNGSDVSFDMMARAGFQGDDAMYEDAIGDMAVYYKESCYGVITQAVHLRRVIYIPQNTPNTTDAYIAAAKKRIDEYLGKNDITIELGASLDTLPIDYQDKLIDKTKTDGNYYNVTIKGKTYKFYIMKGTAEELKMPTYLGTNIENNIKVTTNKSEVPLDTEIRVDVVAGAEMEKVLGTKNYKAYDIDLHSAGKEGFVTKLSNGKFQVTIPVPETLKNKSIAIYHVDSNGKTTEHKAIVKNGIATFETDHFSTYAIAEQAKDITPNTGIQNNIKIFALISIVSFAGYVILRHKKQEQN